MKLMVFIIFSGECATVAIFGKIGGFVEILSNKIATVALREPRESSKT
jgi:hypothetical protein